MGPELWVEGGWKRKRVGSHNMLREVGVGESGFEFVAAGGVVPVEGKGPKQINKRKKIK